jgi:RNA-binding protein YhbY
MGIKARPDQTRLAIAWQDPAIMQIGKGGVTEGLVAEGKRLLKKHKYIKVRLLRSVGADKDSKGGLFEDFALKIGGNLAGVRGNTAVVFK